MGIQFLLGRIGIGGIGRITFWGIWRIGKFVNLGVEKMEVLLSQSVSGMAASRRRRGGGRAGVRGGRDLAQHADVGLRLCSTQDQSASGARPGSTSGPSLQVASIPSRSPTCARGSIFLRGGSSDAYGLLPCAGGAADARTPPPLTTTQRPQEALVRPPTMTTTQRPQ